VVTYSQIKKLLLGITPSESRVEKLIELLLDRVSCCILSDCRELFIDRNELSEHIERTHQSQLQSSFLKRVTDHLVEEGDSKIYICPHCYFAIGEESRMRASSGIYRHVRDCEWNLSRRYGPPQVSFKISYDVELINAYICNRHEIQLFLCPQCGQFFGSQKNLVYHLSHDHSTVSARDLTEEQLNPFLKTAERHAKGMVKLITKPGVVPIPESGVRKPSSEANPIPPAPTTSRQGSMQSRTQTGQRRIDIGSMFSRTITIDELQKGILNLPKQLGTILGYAKEVQVRFAHDNRKTTIPYDSSMRCLKDLGEWFCKNAFEPGDKIKYRIMSIDPLEFRMWTEWEKHLNYLYHSPPEDFKWSIFPIRDCLLKVFSLHEGPQHYRSLYSQISKHRELAMGSVISSLSRHRGKLFEHVGRGMWKHIQYNNVLREYPPTIEQIHFAEVNEDIWTLVAKIEREDIVYHLLTRVREPLSFNQICKMIADSRGIVSHELHETGFLNADDPRLVRFENGLFGLREWLDKPEEMPPLTNGRKENEPVQSQPVRQSLNIAMIRMLLRRILRVLFSWLHWRSRG
jgi:uncharacterized C2H2 Zn-finger protein